MEEDLEGYDPDVPCEMFAIELLRCLREYENVLLSREPRPATVKKHGDIISSFIGYICLERGAAGHEQVTVGMANSGFRRYMDSHGEGLQASTLKNTLKGFYIFLADVHGIRNGRLLASFDR